MSNNNCLIPECDGLALGNVYCEYHLRVRAREALEEQAKLRPMKSRDTKPTNPKDSIGCKKVGTTLVPDVITYYASLGLLEGALKYGTANWSEAGVRVSIYLDAASRHLSKFKAGEWADPKTKVPHLASVLACVGIILDANMRGMITDDRPPANPNLIRWIDEAQKAVEHLQEVFADCDPKHYTMQELAPPGYLYGAD